MIAEGTTHKGKELEPSEGMAKVRFEGLPLEAQEHCFSYVSTSDLIALSLVSKHFRDLAAVQLYRDFHIVFPDEDDPSYESPIDGLASGLETFVTSDYDYARYLKAVVMNTLSGGERGEKAYRHYTYDYSCGKFMNTLFLLTLRKARNLETFKWDLRVELSRQVFKALHQLPALRNLHLRMQAGHSLYEIPPPLPSLAEPDPLLSNPNHSALPPYLSPAMNSFNTAYSTAKKITKHKSRLKDKKAEDRSTNGSSEVEIPKEPPTLSGFKDLKSLAVLDMDTLDDIAELRKCLQNCASTLTELKLSFSDHLGRAARKPPPTEDTDESDQEIDEFGNVIPALPPPPPLSAQAEDPTGPAKAFRAQREKKRQDAFLPCIFSLESSSMQLNDAELDNEEEERPEEDIREPGKKFITDLTSLSTRLMNAVNGNGGRSTSQKEALQIIESAARKYVEATKDDTKTKKKEDDSRKDANDASSVVDGGINEPAASAALIDGERSIDMVDHSGESEEKASTMFDEQTEKRTKRVDHPNGSTPDDINIEDPEIEIETGDLEDTSITDDSVPVATDNAPTDTTVEEDVDEETNEDRSDIDAAVPEIDTNKSKTEEAALESIQTHLTKLTKDIQRIGTIVAKARQDPSVATQWEANKQDFDDHFEAIVKLSNTLGQAVQRESKTTAILKSLQHQMTAYVRESRGLQLKSLSIYLIPIKASVLAKAIDLSVLTRVTLLNVGPQAPFWNLLIKTGTESPVALRNIFTDNVTTQFLTCVTQLPELHELFMVERSTTVREYSFTPKTTITMDQIRRSVVKKHIGTLKKLLIRNENDASWDANEVTLKLLCKKGKKLDELAVSFSVRAVHVFNQYLPGLTSLRAMHIIQFRNDDTCHWVVREIRKFAVDCISHNPGMKLEYIALENTVERLVHRAKNPKKDRKAVKGKTAESTDDDKGKDEKNEVLAIDSGPAASSIQHILSNSSGSGGNAGEYMTLASVLAKAGDDSESDSGLDDTDDDDWGVGLKLEALEGLRFYDVETVRIFAKDVLAAKL